MRISDWSSDVCSSDLTPPLKRRGLFSLRQLHRRHHIPRIAQRSDEAVEMLAVARLAFDVGDQPLCGQRRDDALVIDFDDVDLLLVEQLHHLEQRAGPVLRSAETPTALTSLQRIS